MKYATFEEALGACMATIAKAARANATVQQLAAGARGAINAWATEYLEDGTPIFVTLQIQRGEQQPADRVASYTLESDAGPSAAVPDALPARRPRSLPRARKP